jgi:hypothetical protein
MTGTKFGFAVVLALLGAMPIGVAKSANMPLKAPAPVIDNWTGYYAGINAGGAIAVDPTTDTGVLSSHLLLASIRYSMNHSGTHPSERLWAVNSGITGRFDRNGMPDGRQIGNGRPRRGTQT